MTFSVIIATHNRAGHLGDTLRSLAGVSTSASWEVIVVDNNSQDGTRDVVTTAAASFPVPLRYVFEAEQGKAAALNAGMKLATGRIFAFTDDDARFERDWLDQAAQTLEQTGADYVGGRSCRYGVDRGRHGSRTATASSGASSRCWTSVPNPSSSAVARSIGPSGSTWRCAARSSTGRAHGTTGSIEKATPFAARGSGNGACGPALQA